ncbi:AsmA family protein [Kangiella aquimarina]|uniref:AsmA-like C-terminal region-containing protein n=1 Tax=Kangiella aquimarina TaxID=261965 RepID=A0ABZ0X7Y0_9GAMM|nr:AsmA-like C-terminal region-containing protein [Kangiella aquimarina]WQG86501.1 AsmA-like C-terminal region-containing protein [Kangiella aquimarina]
MTKLWKWGKRLLWVLAGLIILLVISVSILVYLINSEAFLEKQIEEQLGMSSQVGELDVSLFSGTVSIARTRIGPQDNPAVTFEQLTAELSYSGLFSSLLIDSVELDKATIRYPFDYQLAQTNGESTTGESSNEEEPFFFENLNVSEIRINDSSFIFDDEVYLEANGINLVVSDLPIAQSSTFLFAKLNDFFNQSNTTIVADIKQLKTDKSSLNGVNLKASVQDSSVMIEELSSQSADINIQLASNQQVSTRVPEQQIELENLPFEDLFVETVKLGNTNINIEGSYQLAVKDFAATFSELILVKSKRPLWNDWEAFYAEQNSQYALSSQSLSSDNLSYDHLELEGDLSSSTFDVKKLLLEKPYVNYSSLPQDSNPQDESEPASVAAAEAEQLDIRFPFAGVQISQLTITEGKLNLELGDPYQAQSINATVKQLPVILEHKLVIAEPGSWPSKASANIEASDIKMPSGTVATFATEIISDTGNLTAATFQLSGVNLDLDLSGTNKPDKSAKNSAEAVALPFQSILLADINIDQLSMLATLTDDEIKVVNARFEIDELPLVLEQALFTLNDVSNLDTSFKLDAESLQSKQVSIQKLSTSGTISESRLVLERLTNQSGKLSLDFTKQSDEQVDISSDNSESKLPLESVLVNNLNIRNFNGDILRLVERLDVDGNAVTSKESLVVTDVDLTATNLSLVKNGQLISRWYDSQLQNAFTNIELKIAKAQQDEDVFSDIDIKATQRNQKITVSPLKIRVNDTDLDADWVIDLSQPGYLSKFNFNFENLELSQLVRPDNEESVALRGKLNGLADLSFTGLAPESIFDSLNGQIQVANTEPVQLINLNVNKVLERFLESQEFGLLDIGGFVLAGPAGLLLSQGVSMQGVLSNLGANKGNTMFGQINIDMVVENGVLKTRDVAASTQYYRFAFDGNIDLSIMAFNDFEFMILNDEGCKEYSQTLNGSLSSPEIETFRTAFDAVTGSVVGLLKSGVGLLTGGYCESVYDGKVTHPEEGVEIPHPELKPEEPEIEGDSSKGVGERETGEGTDSTESNEEPESEEPTQ